MAQELVQAGQGTLPRGRQAAQDNMPPATGTSVPRPKLRRPAAAHLNGRQKAAVIVRLLLAEGERLPLNALPEDMQTALTEQIAALRLIDRVTLDAVVGEFLETLDQVGLAFTDGLHGALNLLGGQISEAAAARLRRIAASSENADPWETLEVAEPEAVAELLRAENAQIGAVALSQLSTTRAAAVLGLMPGDMARAVALAMAQTEAVSPQIVRRIGAALARQIDQRPARAFATEPGRRMGEILDVTPSALRDTVLSQIEAANADYARDVRRAIFTYTDIPARLPPLEAPRVLRVVDQEVAVTALAGTLPQEGTALAAASQFLLANISQRLAASLREEVDSRGAVSPRALDEATTEVVAAIRRLARNGEITLTDPDGD